MSVATVAQIDQTWETTRSLHRAPEVVFHKPEKCKKQMGKKETKNFICGREEQVLRLVSVEPRLKWCFAGLLWESLKVEYGEWAEHLADI